MSNEEFEPNKLVEITEQMIFAGIDELREQQFGTDMREIVKAVYFAMEYAKEDYTDKPSRRAGLACAR